MEAFVPTPGTIAGDQLAAVLQLPAAAAAQTVCAEAAGEKENVTSKNKKNAFAAGTEEMREDKGAKGFIYYQQSNSRFEDCHHQHF